MPKQKARENGEEFHFFLRGIQKELKCCLLTEMKLSEQNKVVEEIQIILNERRRAVCHTQLNT